MAKATDYVDAGRAVDQVALTRVVGTAPPVANNVTYERILNARSEPHNWLTYYGAYDGQRYSPLDQINTENVRRLTPMWVFQHGASGLQAGATTYSFEAAPIVVDGVMYVTTVNEAYAIDAASARQIWHYARSVSPGLVGDAVRFPGGRCSRVVPGDSYDGVLIDGPARHRNYGPATCGDGIRKSGARILRHR